MFSRFAYNDKNDGIGLSDNCSLGVVWGEGV